MTTKVTAAHLQRDACVYLRQSTPGQVLDHRESTERQYKLVERAESLGWLPGQIRVLDGDLGKSGKTAEGRNDFHQLCAAVGLSEIGAVLALEASRLSRSQADWHRLLELCAWTHTLIVDHDGAYDPNDFNDRILLGFKGTWSHTELHAMRMRLHGAMLHKARKGELKCHLPTGYVHDDSGALVLDPDEGVVAAIRSVFELFRSVGSAYGVERYYAERKLLFPRRLWKRVPQSVPLEWGPLRATRVTSILHNPTYTGAYVYGRRPSRPVVRDGQLVGVRQVELPREEWEVFLPDAHPAYISWEEYLDNERLLTMNRTNFESSERQGRPRSGSALLQGLVLCGRCGRRMQVRYRSGGERLPVYLCPRRPVDPEKGTMCWTTPGRRVDQAVERHVLDALTQDNLDLSLEILRHLEQEAEQAEQQWQLRLERARQEVARAERQYNLVEPENRLVVRTLERRWEEKLAALEEMERAYEEALRQPRLDLSPEERERILRLASDLPSIWNAPTTRHEERKEMLGLLVRQVALVPEDVPRRQTRVRVLWHTGAVTELVVERPEKYDAIRTSPEVIQAIQQLMPNHTDAEIARVLNERGHRTGRGLSFDAGKVSNHRHAYGMWRRDKDKRAAARLDPRDDGRYSTRALAHLLGVHTDTVHYWRKKGLIPAIQESERGPWWHDVTPELLDKLRQNAQRTRGRRGSPPK
ncbi:MAG: recombinase family protein [Deltaproteobacteria bacterium]|nr:recombinase family protein [Deltaproteobacteria bacterium]